MSTDRVYELTVRFQTYKDPDEALDIIQSKVSTGAEIIRQREVYEPRDGDVVVGVNTWFRSAGKWFAANYQANLDDDAIIQDVIHGLDRLVMRDGKVV